MHLPSVVKSFLDENGFLIAIGILNMNIQNNTNLAQLLVDVKAFTFATQPKRLTGNAGYFTNITAEVIDATDYDLGDREHLKNSIEHRLNNTFDKHGKKCTQWGYKRVLEVVEQAFKYVNQ